MRSSKQEHTMRRRGRLFRKAAAMLFALCLAGSMGLTALAAPKEETTYTVRLFAGAHGTVGGQEMLVYTGLKYGSPLPFNQRMVTLDGGSKYYIKGIRESGKDNNTTPTADQLEKEYTVTEDQDYVVAYGVLGNSVAYTVQFQTEDGTDLAPPETYYGNVGDRPVIAFLYIDGYLPQAYNLTGTLQRDEASNVFTFVYTPVSPEAAAAGAAAGAAAAAPAAAAPAAAAPAAAAGAGAGAAAGAGDAAAAAAAAAAEGVAPPEDLVEVGDEETPLANPEGEEDEGNTLRNVEDERTPLSSGDFATVLWNLPVAAKVGILSLLILAGAGGGYVYARKKGKIGHAE